MLVVKRFKFDAAHFIPDYEGPCGQLHGHTYVLEVGVEGYAGKSGMVIDFGDLTKVVRERILQYVDHTDLNQLLGIPTAENIVYWIRQELRRAWEDFNLPGQVILIRLWETYPDSYVEYRR